MSTKTSHKKNRPFNFKLIDLIEPHQILYSRLMPGMSTFEIMKTKNLLWQQISAEMQYPAQFCMGRWSNLRRRYQFEMDRNSQLCTKTGIIRTSYWPYLNRLKFLDNYYQPLQPKKEKKPKRKAKPKQKKVIQKSWSDEDDSDNHFSDDFDRDCNVEDHITATNIIKEETVKVEKREIIKDNFHQMQVLLAGFEGESLTRIERRLMAFLCKCQLRALSGDQTIDDLYV